MNGSDSVLKVFLMNGESRSLRLDERMDVTDVVRSVLMRLRVNMDVALQLFSIQLRHINSGESYWFQPGFTVAEQLSSHTARKPLEEWKFLLRIRVLPRTPQHLLNEDPVTFQYFYDQVLNRYLGDDDIVIDNETAVKLGCLELRRFFKDMPQIALKKRENFAMLEKDIGLEKFFKSSLLSSVKRKNLRTMVLQAFQQYESLTMEGCIFQFFSLLSKYHAIDVETFHNCAIGDDQMTTLSYEIFVGANCNVEFQPEGGERKFLAAFSDIQDICYETELMSRGRVVMDVKTSGVPVVIRTATLVTAIQLATLVDAYCMVYTPNPHSRMSGVGRKRYSNTSRLSSLYSYAEEERMRADPFSITVAHGDDYAEVREPERQVLGRSILPSEVTLEERIGEGQFGDVHKGTLYPGAKEETEVAIKTCKSDASHEERVKFLEEAAVMRKFDHPHIIKLFGVVSRSKETYIVMELAPLGQLRRYLLTEGARIPKLLLLQYIHQLASAMVHLEGKSYVHRDIAARNVLVTSTDVIKLADFGLSRGLQDGNYYVASRGKLPIKWMAPESINFRRFTGLSDVWMFGVCCWEIMMRGVKPFVGIKNDEVIAKIEMGERLPLPTEAPAPLFGLMNRCWSYEPDKRPDFRLVEETIAMVVEEEKQLATLTSRRLLPDLAPQKPPYRPHSSQGFLQQRSRDSAAGVSDDEATQQRMSGNSDDVPLGPSLPPRISTRFRELSPGPPVPSPSNRNGSLTPPPLKPPRRPSPTSDNEVPSHSRGNHTHPPIIPYSVTTITPMDSTARHMSTSDTRRSESPHHPVAMATIPPPSILQRASDVAQTVHTPSNTDVYYSIPEDGGRSLREDGQFISSRASEHSSVAESESSHEGEEKVEEVRGGEVRSGEVRGGEVSTGDVSAGEVRSEEGEGVKVNNAELEQTVLGKVTDVVKAVMELSNRVSLYPPDQYLELVKVVGMAMRELLHTVDGVRRQLPTQFHQEMDMAQKVLSSDFNNLIKAMKDAQKHANTFLEGEYQREMLAAAHVVAKNSKLLFDAVVSSMRRGLQQQLHR